MLSLEEITSLKDNLHLLTPAGKQELLDSLEELERREHVLACQNDLLEFCKEMDPKYKVGAHHRKLARLLMDMEAGVTDRIGVSIPPRHGKSHMISTMFPAWYLGRHPDQMVMLVSHTADLAVDFGRKVRNIIGSQKYGELFPTVSLSVDSKSAGRWNTNVGGGFYATGVGSALAGRGADFLIIDDPFSEQDILAGNYDVFEKAYQWFMFGARTRLMKDGRIAVVHTRWHPSDLIGKLAQAMTISPDGDQYKFFEFPAILYENTPEEKALWPEFFDLEALHRTKASMPLFQWNAQYQQNPTGEQGAIVKRESWRPWTRDEPPRCEYLIMSLDAASEAKQRADYSAVTVWGVFRDDVLTKGEPNIILLNAVWERVQFYELKALALREYKFWEPDCFIIEKKSNGTAVLQELRRMGIPVQEFNPSRATGDKVMRLTVISDIFQSGLVWYPEGRKWAEVLIEQVAAFPAVANDDLVDCTSMAITRFREGRFISLPSDAVDEEHERLPNTQYY